MSGKDNDVRRRRADFVRELRLNQAHTRNHSPTGVMRRRIRLNPETGEPEVLPEPVRQIKPRAMSPASLRNLRNGPKGRP